MRITAANLRSHGHQVWYPQFPSPDTPNPTEWQDLLRQEVNMMDEVEGGEKIAIAHSLGTINWLYGAMDEIFNKPFDRVLLVAIPDPVMTNVAPGITGAPMDFAIPGISAKVKSQTGSIEAVASDMDRWQPNGIDFYQQLDIPTTIVPGAGHFSLDDGWGGWQGLERWVETGDGSSLVARDRLLES